VRRPKTISLILAAIAGILMGLALSTMKASGEAEIMPAIKVQIDLINTALYKGHSVKEAMYIKSRYHSKIYYIGAIVRTKDKGDVLTLWATNVFYDRPVGLLFSVNELAYELSGMGKGKNTKARVWRNDPEARALRNYFNVEWDY